MLRNVFRLNETRKSFLVIWVIIMILPTIFVIGMVNSNVKVREIVETDGGIFTFYRVLNWSDLVYYFLVLIFGTICMYWVVGLENENNDGDKNKCMKKRYHL